MRSVSSLALLLSNGAISFALTLFLARWGDVFDVTSSLDFLVLFTVVAAFTALVTTLSLHFARQHNGPSAETLEMRDLEIGLREEALSEHTIVGISDLEGTVLSVNRSFLEAFGYTRDEILGQKGDILYAPEDLPALQEIRRTVAAGHVWKGMQRLRTKDGRVVRVQTSILPRFDQLGYVRDALSIRTDLTRAMAEGASEGRNALVEALPDEVYIYDAQTFRFAYLNENARRRVRIDGGEASERCLLDYFTPQETSIFRRHIDPVLKGEQKIARIEIDHVSGPIEVLTHLDLSPNGTRHLVSVVRDITERREAEQAKLNSVSTVSHELRTPLTSIKGALRLLESGVVGELSPEIARVVGVASRNSERLLAIVNDILVLQKLSSGEMTFTRRTMDLRELLAEATEANAAFAQDCGVQFTVRPEPAPAFVHADPDRLMQVMSNLMSNAAKFSPAGSMVELFLEDRGDAWRVAVRDQGPGIPEGARATIFDSFTQVEGVRSTKHPGTGLGLTICRKIIQMHGGVIAFDTEVGRGTTFHFEIEKATPDVVAAPAGAATAAA